MDELLKALQAAFPGLKWERDDGHEWYSARIGDGCIIAVLQGVIGGYLALNVGSVPVYIASWYRLPGRAEAIAKFQQVLRVAAVAAAGMEVHNGK